MGSKNRYAYLTEICDGKPGNIVKVDIHTGSIVTSTNISGEYYGGECMFIESNNKNGPHAEDDGYIASFVTKKDTLNGPESLSELRVWNAKDLSDITQIYIPFRVPLGFHSLFFESV